MAPRKTQIKRSSVPASDTKRNRKSRAMRVQPNTVHCFMPGSPELVWQAQGHVYRTPFSSAAASRLETAKRHVLTSAQTQERTGRHAWQER